MKLFILLISFSLALSLSRPPRSIEQDDEVRPPRSIEQDDEVRPPRSIEEEERSIEEEERSIEEEERSIEEDVEMRLASSCPQRNYNIKPGKVVPTQCKLIKGKWVKRWEECGAACMGVRPCKAWTFNHGWCSLYKNGITKCGFVRTSSNTIAGTRGCTN